MAVRFIKGASINRNARKVVLSAWIIGLVVIVALFLILKAFVVVPQAQPFSIIRISIIHANNTAYGNAYLASTWEQQQKGLMNMSAIGDCNGSGRCLGMLFMFGSYGEQCFWMKNTKIPLKQSWVNTNGIVEYVYNAVPESTTNVCHAGRYVLETPENSSVAVGDVIRIIENYT